MSRNKMPARCWMTGTRYEIADAVTRGGDERQKILDINGDGGDMIEVECIKEPLAPIALGEEYVVKLMCQERFRKNGLWH